MCNIIGSDHGMTFYFGCCTSAAIFETYFSCDKRYLECCNGLLLCVLLPNCTVSFHTYMSVKQLYSFIAFSLLINAVILLLICLILFHLCIQFFSLTHYFLPLHNLHCLFGKSPDLHTVLLLRGLTVFNAIFPGCGTRTCVMIFCL